MSEGHYKPVNNRPNFDEIERGILEFWEQEGIFTKTLELREGAEEFRFFEGPPTANGKPGIHHVLARTFKDLVCRYKTMRGYRVERRAGWDEHGLPVEIEVQKIYDLKSKSDIEALGIDKFNQLCAESTQKYIADWEKLTERMAYWVDFKTAYRTSAPKYIEREWGILKRLYEKGLLYQGYKVVPWACDSGTVVSQAEVALGYKDVIDETAYVLFELEKESAETLRSRFDLKDEFPVYMLAWTTTPWTLPSNMMLAVGLEIEYTLVQSNQKYIICSSKRLSKVFDQEISTEKSFKGSELIGLNYLGLFESDGYLPVVEGKRQDGSGYVEDSEETGTGIVHTAPQFGEDDLQAYYSNQIQSDIRNAVDPNGIFKQNAPEFLRGQSLFNLAKDGSLQFNRINKIIIKWLEEKDLILKTEKYEHTYPHNWRTGNPLIYYLRPSWYIATRQVREKLLSANQLVNWHPEHVKEGRFGKWLENNVDWSVSRERYWGTPLPIWVGEKTGALCVLGSFDELIEKIGETLPADFNPHRPYIDQYTWEENGEIFRRVPEVLDCWFDSGSMPISSYDLADPSDFESADYICEAVDQTRGWFYTLLAVAVSLDARPPYKNVQCLGHILDKDGQKMSKSKGNVIDPWELFAKYGVDAVRWFMVSAVSAGNPIRFDIEAVSEVIKRYFLTLWNTYAFYVLYANLDQIDPSRLTVAEVSHPIDRWVLANLKVLIQETTDAYDRYEFGRVTQLVEKFTDQLSNIWVRANRHRFWNTKEGGESDYPAYSTLCHCLKEVVRLSAPIMPLVSEEIYFNLRVPSERDSVHLSDWSAEETLSKLDHMLLKDMEKAQSLINIGRNLRQEANLKIRQPLAAIKAPPDQIPEFFAEFVQNELNIKKILPVEADQIVLETELTDELRAEGMARELVHTIQGFRKNSGLDVADRIRLFFQTEQDNHHREKELLLRHKKEIMTEVLAVEWLEDGIPEYLKTKRVKLGDREFTFSLEKIR
ncbi:MAG: isoleucine--tRNA ligase [Candidatus Caenarcaniphilales bacterium]|nr:isoleucine--tRNA ligase [Candidatus Caenarcaniphilales bacterium]